MLFISHKTEDKAIANEVLRRALAHGYSDKQIFLDSDPGSGIEAGAEWESKIYESLKHTRAMLVLCSPNWLKSQWCFVELGYAKAMAISVFPIVIEPCDIGSTLSATQSIDLTVAQDAARDAAFERLWTALEEKHLGPKGNLPWPPPGETDNCPFPGLMCFDEKHAPVFFGREQERDAVIQQLQKMRSNGVPRLLMIVGGSGSGKSSLLRAGVLPWLKHPTEQLDWVVLPTLRYGETPNDDVTLLARLAEIISESYAPNHAQRPSWKDLRNKFESDDVEQAVGDFIDATVDLCQAQQGSSASQGRASTDAPTVLLAIDQYEELLTAAARPSALKFLRFLRTLLSRSNGRLLVISTMRSDYLDIYEQHAESLKPPFLELYRLPPFPWERVGEVIVKPAERVDVTFGDDLIQRLKADSPNSDALPLLAFTLEKLFRQCAGDKMVELHEYEQLGGMAGAISQAVARFLPKDMPKETEHALRLSFVKHLAQVNEQDEFVRRPALWSQLPAAAKPLLEQFVRERLLHRSGAAGDLIEVSHEALFRSWDQLTNWLTESSRILRWRRDVERDRNTAPDSWQGLTRSQLAVARKWPHDRPDELSDDEKTWIKQGIRREHFVVSAIAGTVLLIASLGIWAWYQRGVAFAARNVADQKTEAAEKAATKEAKAKNTALESEKEAYRQLANANLTQAFFERETLKQPLRAGWHFFIAAEALDRANEPVRCRSASLAANLELKTAEALFFHESPVFGAVLNRNESRVLTWTWDGTVRLWDVASGQPVRQWNLETDFCGAKFDQNESRVLTWGGRTVQLWSMSADRPLCEWNHDETVSGAAFNRNESHVLTWSGSTAQLWSVSSSQLVRQWKHDESVLGALLNRDESRLLTWTKEMFSSGQARLWDIASEEPLRRWKHKGGVSGAVFNGNESRVLTWSNFDGTARLWDVTSDEPLRQWKHEGGVSGAMFNRDESRVLTWSDDGTARLWDVTSDEPLRQWKHESEVLGAMFSRDESRVLTWAGGTLAEGEVRLWAVASEQPLRHWKHAGVSMALFNRDESRVLTWSGNPTKAGVVRLWDASSDFPLRELEHGGPVSGAVFSRDESHILAWGWDGTARLWNVTIDRPHRHWENENGVFNQVGSRVITWDLGGSVMLWDVSSEQLLRRWKLEEPIRGAVFNRDESRVLIWSDGKFRGGETWLCDTDSDLPLRRWRQEEGVSGAAFNQNESRVLTWSNTTAQLWNTSSDQSLRKWKIESWSYLWPLFSRDGSRVLIRSSDDVVRLWESSSDMPLRQWKHDDDVEGAVFNRDESYILTWGQDRTVRLFDVSSDQPHRQWKHEKYVKGAMFNRSGTHVLTWSQDMVRLWNISSDEPVRVWKHEMDVDGVVFSRDESRLLTYGFDTVHLWNFLSEQPVRQWKHPGMVLDAMFNHDGSRVLTSSLDGTNQFFNGTIRLWDVAWDQPLHQWSYGTNLEGTVLNQDGSRVFAWGKGGVNVWDMSLDESVTLSERRLEYEVRTATTTDEAGRLRVLKFNEWEPKRQQWAVFQAGRKATKPGGSSSAFPALKP